MKKALLLDAPILVGLLFCSCGGPNKSPSQAPSQTIAEFKPKVGDRDRHGRRATARMASSTTWNGPVNSLALSARVRVRRFLLQCLFDAAKERLSAELHVCWSNDGPRI